MHGALKHTLTRQTDDTVILIPHLLFLHFIPRSFSSPVGTRRNSLVVFRLCSQRVF